MRINVKKVLFVGIEEDKEAFFQQAQQYGIVEFINTRHRLSKEAPPDVQLYTEALKVLKKYSIDEQNISNDVDLEAFARRVVETQNHLEKLLEKKRILEQERVRVEAFGHFCTKDIGYIEESSNRKFTFLMSKKPYEGDALEDPDLLYLNSAHGLHYFVHFAEEKKAFPGFIEMIVEEPLQQVEKKILQAKEEIEEHLENLRDFTHYYTQVSERLIEELNKHNLFSAQSAVEHLLDNNMFAVEGWVAESNFETCKSMLSQKGIITEQVAIEPEDRVPTYLENTGLSRIGEDLVNIYDAPANTDKDPSLWVLWSFALFFAIILGDGGYGLLFLLSAIALQWKFQPTGKAPKRFLKLALILSTSSLIWGVMTCSFFGVKLDVDHPFKKVSALHHVVKKKVAYHFSKKDATYDVWVKDFPELKSLKDPQSIIRTAKVRQGKDIQYPLYDSFSDGILMEFALLVGVIHICLSFMRMLMINWNGLGWIIAILGGYLYLPPSDFLKATSLTHYLLDIDPAFAMTLGAMMMKVGIGLAVVFSVIQNKLMGLFELTNVIQVFSDILSYLRLYALGLAGGMVSQTFNQMGLDLMAAGAIGMAAGPLVIIMGHMINILLSLMGGVIHGLRLNFLEWYHYCFEGGGKLFRPLTKLEKKILKLGV